MDIGVALGTVATMGSLIRTGSGMFTADSAVKIQQIRNAAADGNLIDLCIPVEKVLPYPKAFVKTEGLSMAKNGNPLPLALVDMPSEDETLVESGSETKHQFWLYSQDGLIGLYSHTHGVTKLRLEVMM